MTSAPSQIAPADLDALVEVATIGSGQALTALGKLIRRSIAMDVPEAWVGRGGGAIADFLGALGEELVLVAVRVGGPLAGLIVLALPGRDAHQLAAHLGQPIDAGWNPMAESALMETGNIVGSAFVSAIAQMVGTTLLPSVPTLVRGDGRDCVDRLVGRDAASMALAARFSIPSPGALEGLILLVPEAGGISTLLAALRLT